MLLGGCYPKNMKVNWDHYSQLNGTNKKSSKTTGQYRFLMLIKLWWVYGGCVMFCDDLCLWVVDGLFMCCQTVTLWETYKKTMEHHHAIHGKIHYT